LPSHDNGYASDMHRGTIHLHNMHFLGQILCMFFPQS
jgi:hypothetical protein